MGRCRHTSWLRLWKAQSELGLEITDRPQRLLEDFQNPDSDRGGLLMLIGNRSKRAAFTTLRIQNGTLGQRGNGEVHLFASSFKGREAIRFLIADADIPRHGRLPFACRNPPCHNVAGERFTARVNPKSASEFSDKLFHKSLFPFADVVCLFVADVGGIEASIRRLASWLDLGRSSTASLRPRLFFIVNKEDEKHARTCLREFKSSIDKSTLEDVFQSVSILAVPSRPSKNGRHKKRSRTRCWDVLRHEVLRSLEASRETRKRSGYLFSIRHLAAFLHHGATSAAQASAMPFDFIKISRLDRGTAPDLSLHLVNFLNQFRSLATLKQIAIPLIASSLLLDHYPPGMHSFNPCDVFNVLYINACWQASRHLTHINRGSLLPSEMVELIKDSMATHYAEVQASGSSVVDWHRLQLSQSHSFLSRASSDETCLCCIRRRPQYTLHCGHAICQTCVKSFHRQGGNDPDSDPWVVQLDACQICGASIQNLLIRLIPDTTRIRVLSIDGGGIRGSAPIAFLKALEDEIGIPNYQVQRHFDVKFGTSSGALSVISLDVLGWSVEDCMCYFKSFAERAFQCPVPIALRMLSKVPVISEVARFLYFVYIMIVDGKYSADGLERLLQETCGPDRTLTNCSASTEMGTHVGVTLTNTHNDYDILPPEVGHGRVRLWEIYFKSRRIGDLGAFQDGGLAFNNPASIALREVAALYPNAPEPSMIVSLGTGSSSSDDDEASGNHSWWGDKFPFRLSRALWRQANSQVAWKQLLGHRILGSRTQYFRFDVDFGGKEPHLDAVDQMDAVGQAAHKAIKGSPTLHCLARCLRAELFFFELDASHPPQFANGCFTCVGHVMCRLRAGTAQYQEFMRQLRETSAALRVGNQKYGFTTEDIGENFSQRVRFVVPNVKDSFEITLVGSDDDCRHISGSPFTLEWLVQSQGLDAWFGTDDHRKRKTSSEYMRLDVKRRRLP
ncbi:acyl transferase/acyl hydrolase/lysophospholipase [Thelonectria olida]|uniref:Acyl transferase/acyl hydrolase/lysophospholipase n=1 Tax=Thelonectria olida TaxID=1576542 RepID=A0A9P9AHK1_9HYPO|nr:acyl transferase/acyl hydrolase/lysophospholipase [Thelonectria olida]